MYVLKYYYILHVFVLLTQKLWHHIVFHAKFNWNISPHFSNQNLFSVWPKSLLSSVLVLEHFSVLCVKPGETDNSFSINQKPVQLHLPSCQPVRLSHMLTDVSGCFMSHGWLQTCHWLFICSPFIQLFMLDTQAGGEGGTWWWKLPFISPPGCGLRSGVHHCRDVLLHQQIVHLTAVFCVWRPLALFPPYFHFDCTFWLARWAKAKQMSSERTKNNLDKSIIHTLNLKQSDFAEMLEIISVVSMQIEMYQDFSELKDVISPKVKILSLASLNTNWNGEKHHVVHCFGEKRIVMTNNCEEWKMLHGC